MIDGIRHGDLLLVEIKQLPKGLEETKTKILMKGSHGHNHSIDEGNVYLKDVDDFVFGYLEATANTTLFHPEHGKKVQGKKLREVKLKPGVYELRKQNEDTHEGMKPVID